MAHHLRRSHGRRGADGRVGAHRQQQRRIPLAPARQHRRHLGSWSPPGGEPEDGERPEDTVARELLEETGLSLEFHRLMVGDVHDPGGQTRQGRRVLGTVGRRRSRAHADRRDHAALVPRRSRPEAGHRPGNRRGHRAVRGMPSESLIPAAAPSRSRKRNHRIGWPGPQE
ncbi:NUDIX domain-containing protein [Streptomyces sp. NPDC006660]|uniref:NUDIX domain-containing protein n=1 Tax=Streptomyces sp. NPDC006660 TaxID=3156901 RepID=UPI00340FA1D8